MNVVVPTVESAIDSLVHANHELEGLVSIGQPHPAGAALPAAQMAALTEALDAGRRAITVLRSAFPVQIQPMPTPEDDHDESW